MSRKSLRAALRNELNTAIDYMITDHAPDALKTVQAAMNDIDDYIILLAQVRYDAIRSLHDDYGWPLAEIGAEIGVSRERIRQVYKASRPIGKASQRSRIAGKVTHPPGEGR